MDWSKPGFPVLHYFREFSPGETITIELVMQYNHFILCCPLIFMSSMFPRIIVFSMESVLCLRWPKYWSFSFNVSHFNEYSVLISFRIDWFDPLAVQGTLKSLLQHHRLKASNLWCPSIFMVQLSHPYMITGKTMALPRRTLSAKWGLCSLIHCLGLSRLFFQGAV